MNCSHCASTVTKERTKQTALGNRTFCCSDCKRTFNERTGTPFNFLEYPTDIVLLVVLWRLRYKLSLRDLAEMFLERGFELLIPVFSVLTHPISVAPDFSFSHSA